MKKPAVISQIEEILGKELHEAPVREDILGGLIAVKKDTPKYAIQGRKLIGLNLAETGLTDEKWTAIRALPDLNPENILGLNLWNNQLTEFRPEWGFKNLTSLDLDDNPLEFPQAEITSKGNEAILSFLREFIDSKGAITEVTVYEAKLLIIGEAGAGKTTLARRLCDPNAPMPDKEKDTTRGIQVEPHEIDEPGSPPFTMHIWDFGGQAIYHSTHQFFLSKRSLYILVLDGRIEEDPHYWLRVQDLLGEDSPVLILINKKGEIRQQLAFQELLGIYSNIQKPLNFFSLRDDKQGLKDFKELVNQNIRTLPHFQKNEKVPKTWANIRSRLEELAQDKNHISLDTFRKICTEEGIEEEGRQDFLCDFLHSLGAILNFSQIPLLRKMVILNPNWATNAVYKVLDHTREHARITGHFLRQELDAIWDDGSYKGVFDEMLALMEKFELCYAIPHKPDEFIVPQLLSPDKPDYEWEDSDSIKLHYKYTFMPKGIVTRLIVRLHRNIVDQQTVWQRGAVFEYEGAKAEVSERYHNRAIYIKTKGVNRKALMTIITHQIDGINSTFDFDERLKVSQLIPCHCSSCKKGETNYFFRKEVLENAKAKKRTHVECQESFEDVSIFRLFDDTFALESYESKLEELAELGRSSKGEYHFHGPVENLNQGEINYYIEQRTLIQELKPFRQLLEAENQVEAENQARYITKEEYDDLIDILEEIEESPKPTDRQKRRWKKQLGKAIANMRKFIGERVEKATDTVIQEEVKDWLKRDGLEALMDVLNKVFS